MNKAIEFYLKELAELYGSKVTGGCYSSDGDFFGLKLHLPNGKKKILWILQDDEGNGAGSFEIADDN